MAAKKLEECFKCAELNKYERAALKALNKGEADEYQQRLSLEVIIKKFSHAHDLMYIPDSFDQSAFMAGRAFVGQKILLTLNIPIRQSKEEENSDETS